VRTSDLDFELPDAAIAQTPAEPRDSARLLEVGPLGPDGGRTHTHRTVAELDQLVGPGDVVVVNNTRVRHARLEFRKETGGRVEVLLLDPLGDGTWQALVQASRPVAPGTRLQGADTEALSAVVGERLDGGRRQVQLDVGGEALDESALTELGHVPLPPYVHTDLDDPERYQTVYAQHTGSVAAPTAGLHLTPDLLARIEAAGAEIHRVQLEVGIGTFQPIRADEVAEHHMHAETYTVSDEVMTACAEAERVVAIGTTTVRALESAGVHGTGRASTELFITRDHEWNVVDCLMTNFHTPRSSLLVMLDAFMGPDWTRTYALAITEGYRFFSLGDAMIVERSGPRTATPTNGAGR